MKLMIFILAVSFSQVSYSDTFQECMGHGRYMSNDERDNRVRRCNREHSGILHDLFGHDEDDEGPVFLGSGDQVEAVRLGVSNNLNCVTGSRDLIKNNIVKCAARNRFVQSSKNENQYRCKLDETKFIFVTMNDSEVSRITLISGANGGSVLANCSGED